VARKPRPPPLSIRLPPDERAELEARADRAGLSVSGYFRSAVLDAPRPRLTRRPSVVEQELGKLMGAVGKIGSNVNQLAHQANLGSWPDSRLVAQACADIRTMRNLLFRALGFTPPDDPPPPGP
jgi:hypothetical protein